ncbi:hypothetical protein [Paenibacillus taichungensis]
MDINQAVSNLYYSEKLSTRQVARQLNIHPNTVRKILHKHYFGTRNSSEAYMLRSTDTYSQKLSATQTGELNSGSKLTSDQVLKIRGLYLAMLNSGYKKSEAQYELADQFRVKRPTISDIVLGRTWKHLD